MLRWTRKRRPSLRRPLPDGSYLTTIRRREYRAGVGYERLEIRVIEAWITITLADGTRRSELWRLLTDLLDADHYPAPELLELYHRRWQAETCYFSLKSTILDGRVLRSRTVPGLEQEVYALLAAYQALIRVADDSTTARPGLSARRISLTVLLQAAADQIVTARGAAPDNPIVLIGAIDRAVLDGLLPARPRQRLKARYRKTASKYGFKRGDHPRAVQKYTLQVQSIRDGVLDTAPEP